MQSSRWPRRHRCQRLRRSRRSRLHRSRRSRLRRSRRSRLHRSRRSRLHRSRLRVNRNPIRVGVADGARKKMTMRSRRSTRPPPGRCSLPWPWTYRVPERPRRRGRRHGDRADVGPRSDSMSPVNARHRWREDLQDRHRRRHRHRPGLRKIPIRTAKQCVHPKTLRRDPRVPGRRAAFGGAAHPTRSTFPTETGCRKRQCWACHPRRPERRLRRQRSRSNGSTRPAGSDRRRCRLSADPMIPSRLRHRRWPSPSSVVTPNRHRGLPVLGRRACGGSSMRHLRHRCSVPVPAPILAPSVRHRGSVPAPPHDPSVKQLPSFTASRRHSAGVQESCWTARKIASAIGRPSVPSVLPARRVI
jgi:hypothetical protein